MTLKIKYGLLLLLFFQVVQTQEKILATLSDSLPIKNQYFIHQDEFENDYFLKENVLIKKTAVKTYQYQNVQLGYLKSVDLLNPFEITLFYPNFNIVVQLDNTLNEINRVDFNALVNFKSVLFAQTAIDKQLWIFDENTQFLELFDFQNNTTIVSSQPIPNKPIAMVGNYNFCWLLTKEKLYQYNTYGSLLKTYPNQGWTTLVALNNKVLAFNLNGAYLMSENQQTQILFSPLKQPIEQLQLLDDNLYLYSKGKRYTYRLQQPKKQK